MNILEIGKKLAKRESGSKIPGIASAVDLKYRVITGSKNKFGVL